MQNRLPTVVLSLLVGLTLVTLGSGVQAQAPKELAGTWKLDAARSKFSPGPAPKSMTITYTPTSDTIKIVVDVAPADGPAQHWEMAASYDGKDYPVTGNPMADSTSFKSVNTHTVESTFKKGGKVTAMNSRVLSKDGKTLTITSKGTTADGKPREDVQVFTK